MKLTPAQKRILLLTQQDFALTIGGIDGRKVRKDVVMRLHAMGLLAWRAPTSFYEHSEWVLTEEGKAMASNIHTGERHGE